MSRYAIVHESIIVGSFIIVCLRLEIWVDQVLSLSREGNSCSSPLGRYIVLLRNNKIWYNFSWL